MEMFVNSQIIYSALCVNNNIILSSNLIFSSMFKLFNLNFIRISRKNLRVGLKNLEIASFIIELYFLLVLTFLLQLCCSFGIKQFCLYPICEYVYSTRHNSKL